MKIISESNFRIVCSLPPKRRTILTTTKNSDSKYSFFLSFPHMVFTLHLLDGSSFSDEPPTIEMYAMFTDSNSILYLPPLPNTDRNGVVCMGYAGRGQRVSEILASRWDNRNAAEIAQEIIDCYFSSVFKFGDIDDCVKVYLEHADACRRAGRNATNLYSLHLWQEKTLSDPSWVPGPDDMVSVSSSVQGIFQ